MTQTYDILVADDEAPILDFIFHALSDEGYTVKTVYDGASALLAIQTAQPRLLLLDNAMPVMTGAEVLVRVRKHGGDGLPIIMMSANAHARELIQLGANDFLPKPFTLDQLLTMVARHMPKAEG